MIAHGQEGSNSELIDFDFWERGKPRLSDEPVELTSQHPTVRHPECCSCRRG
jgi:hypothetical protein